MERRVKLALAGIILVILLTTILSLPGCSNKSVDKDTIKVGVILPLSGVRSDAGESHSKGLELALEEINNNPKNKYKIELMYEDDQYDPKQGVSGFKELTEKENVNFIIGPVGTSVVLGVAPVAEEKKIILVTPGAQGDQITNSGDYIFRTMTRFSQDAPILGKIVAQKTKGKKVHVLGLNTDALPSIINAFSKTFTENGGQFGLIEKYSPTEKDFRSILTKIKAEGVKEESEDDNIGNAEAKNKEGNTVHIMLFGIPKAVSLQLKQAKELGINAKYYGISALESRELIESAGELANGIIFLSPYDDFGSDEKVKEFQGKYMRRYNEKNDMYAAISYDTLHVLSDCFGRFGNNYNDDSEEGIEEIKNCLYGTQNYDGASGRFSFDSNGDVDRDFVLKEIINKEFVTVDRLE